MSKEKCSNLKTKLFLQYTLGTLVCKFHDLRLLASDTLKCIAIRNSVFSFY